MLNKKPLPTDTLTWLFILAGVILPLSILFFDTPERDECYQALCVLNYKRSPLAPLSFFNGYMWLKFFGVTVPSCGNRTRLLAVLSPHCR